MHKKEQLCKNGTKDAKLCKSISNIEKLQKNEVGKAETCKNTVRNIKLRKTGGKVAKISKKDVGL